MVTTDITLFAKWASGTSLPDTEETPVYAYAYGGGIVVVNALPSTSIAVYNITGVLQASVRAAADQTAVSLPQKGLYLVRVNGTTLKVIVR